MGASLSGGGEWLRAGILRISDICHPNTGTFLSHEELASRYNVVCSFLDILKIRMSIPLHWRRRMTDIPMQEGLRMSDFEIKIPNQDLVDASAIGAKATYQLINEAKDTVCTAYTRWQEGIEETTISNPDEWREVCNNPFRANRETKIQSLHYKIIHRIFPCGTYLCRVRVRDSDWCQFCDATDSITHHLYRCDKVRPFWDSLSRWFRQQVDLYLDQLTAKEIILGLPKGAHQRDAINDILLSIKFYIYRQKMFHEGNLDMLHWLAEFRAKIKREKWIRKRIGAKPANIIYDRILEALG